MIHRRREQLLSITEDDVKEVAELYLKKGKLNSIAIIGEGKPEILNDKEWKISIHPILCDGIRDYRY